MMGETALLHPMKLNHPGRTQSPEALCYIANKFGINIMSASAAVWKSLCLYVQEKTKYSEIYQGKRPIGTLRLAFTGGSEMKPSQLRSILSMIHGGSITSVEHNGSNNEKINNSAEDVSFKVIYGAT